MDLFRSATVRVWDTPDLAGTRAAVEAFDCSRPLFVAGAASADALNLGAILDARWPHEEKRVVTGNFAGSPIPAVLRLRTTIRQFAPDVVVAIGGGSVIDTAKAASVLATLDRADAKDVAALWNVWPAPVPPRGHRLVAIPTTAGTGTEATPYAVLSDERNVKLFGVSREFQPDLAVLVPHFVTTVPRDVIAELAMDALSHALEAFWSRKATLSSDVSATTALALLDGYLANYWKSPTDLVAARGVLLAATHAGDAFRQASSTACHALSFPIAEQLHSSHGSACSLLLANVADINLRDHVTRLKLESLAACLGIRGAAEIPSYIRQWRTRLRLNEEIEQPVHLSPEWPPAPLQEMMANNPVRLEASLVRDLLASLVTA
jgi:alcohol dehydrogenase